MVDAAVLVRAPAGSAGHPQAAGRRSFAEGDAADIAKAPGVIAREEGSTLMARDAGLSRESLYKALSGARSPDFDTILRVVRALGLQLHAGTAQDSTARVVVHRGSRGSSGG